MAIMFAIFFFFSSFFLANHSTSPSKISLNVPSFPQLTALCKSYPSRMTGQSDIPPCMSYSIYAHMAKMKKALCTNTMLPIRVVTCKKLLHAMIELCASLHVVVDSCWVVLSFRCVVSSTSTPYPFRGILIHGLKHGAPTRSITYQER
jgi:hypothetical protein